MLLERGTGFLLKKLLQVTPAWFFISSEYKKMLRVQTHRKTNIRQITKSLLDYNKYEKEAELIGERTAKDVSIYDLLVSHCS